MAADNVDAITKSIGQMGKYQIWVCFLIFLNKFPIAWHQMAIIFLSPKVVFKCDDIPYKCPCPNPEYNTSVFTNTIGMRWNLICEKKWLQSFSQMLFQLGTFSGSIVFGMASDRYGRKWPLIASVIIQTAAGAAAAYAPTFWLFNTLRFIVGVSVGGTMVIGFVVIMEFSGTQYRAPVSALYQVPFNMGHLSLPLFSFYNRDYRAFQMIISAPVAVLFSYICLLPETPRWLIAMKRTDEVVTMCESIAKINGMPTANIKSDIQAYQAQLEKLNLKKGSLADCFQYPNLRKNLLAMAYNWLACSYCFYGISQYISHLTGDIFTNVAFSAAVTLIGTFLSIPLIKLLNRRTMLVIFQGICASCLIMLAFIPEGTLSVICASIGDVCAFVVYILVYLYCTELFPTVVRSAALGFSSMSARIGSMVAPFIIELRDTALWLPPIAFGVVPALAVFIALLLPETKDCELMTTIAEGEAFGKKKPTPP